MKGSMDNALLVLCRIGEEDQVLRLLKELTAASTLDSNMVNQTDKTGRTSLSYACANGFQRVVEYLTSLDITEINKADTEGHTPLHYAAQAGNVEVVSHLVNKCHRDVDLDARNNLGFTPLMKSALQGRTKCAKMLLFAGASPHLRDTGRGLNAMEWAKYTGRHVCCELIESVQKSCSSHIKDRWASDPDLKGDVPGSLNALSQHDKDSWIKHKIKKAFKGSESSSSNKRGSFGSGGECLVADKLSTMAVCATTPLLPQAVAQDLKPSVPHQPSVVPSLQVTEVKAKDCYEEPEDPPATSTNKSQGQSSGNKSNTTKSTSSNSKTSTGGKKKK
ncbi:unnamed protein product [Meganyctiphanes norvegica]|uniref:Uncharacterized protein n=1 Tax=Meganyctiphanes norvegica TaxID=48144 RepID=A0AAV2R2Q6_MEGNR